MRPCLCQEVGERGQCVKHGPSRPRRGLGTARDGRAMRIVLLRPIQSVVRLSSTAPEEPRPGRVQHDGAREHEPEHGASQRRGPRGRPPRARVPLAQARTREDGPAPCREMEARARAREEVTRGDERPAMEGRGEVPREPREELAPRRPGARRAKAELGDVHQDEESADHAGGADGARPSRGIRARLGVGGAPPNHETGRREPHAVGGVEEQRQVHEHDLDREEAGDAVVHRDRTDERTLAPDRACVRDGVEDEEGAEGRETRQSEQAAGGRGGGHSACYAW